MCKKLIIFCLTLAAAATIASGEAITYVDAVDGATGNLTYAAGGVFTALGVRSGTDNLWWKRTNLANPGGGAGTVFEAHAGLGGVQTGHTEDCPRLAQTVAVPLDTYKVYVFFWADGSQWRVRAKLTNSTYLPMYYANTINEATEQPPFGDPKAIKAQRLGYSAYKWPLPMFTEGVRTMWIAYLGTVTGTSFSVYIDDDPDTVEGNVYERTWYDGVGYIPEPSTIALLALGGLSLLRSKHVSYRRS